MRALVISSSLMMVALGQEPASEPLVLHDPPKFKKGQFETSTDAGAHASAGAAARTTKAPDTTPASRTIETKLRQAQSAQPTSFDANLSLGQFLLGAGRPAEAVRFLDLARKLKPESVPARHDLFVALVETGKFGEAEALLRELQKEAPSASTVHLEARWLAASGKPALAAERFQQAAEAEPTETHLFDWGNHMLAHGAAEPAGKIFAYAVGRFPRSARLKVAQAVSYYAQGNYDHAIRTLREGIALNPKDLRPLVFLGQMIGVSPELERDVQRELERFAALYPEHAQAQYFYGLSLVTLNDQKSGERYLRRAAALDPKMPEAHLELGKLYADSGRAEQAVQELRIAIQLSPGLSAGHYKLGQLYQRSGQTALADQHFAVYRKLRAEQTAREEQERRQRIGLAEKR